MKAKIFNLIILDESGSMDCVTSQTISGCNETINTICSAQKEFSETQEHFVSIYAFQSGGSYPSRYIVKNMPAAEAGHISEADYCPYGGTPLYDAVGGTLADLKAIVKSEKNAIGSVTIITDGWENSSRHYSQRQVASMIDALKECGWSFNFIGANIDAQQTGASLNIDNTLQFQQTQEGTREMFERERRARHSYYNRNHIAMKEMMDGASDESVAEVLKGNARNYFDDENLDEEEASSK